MRFSLQLRAAGLALALLGAPAAAAAEMFSGADDGFCLDYAAAPEAAIEAAAPELAGGTIASLVAEALLRHCAAIGAIAEPDRPESEGTRTIVPVETDTADPSEVLAREAEYYIEVAMGIDADAANDLLRRLLGPKPGETDRSN